MEALLFLDKSCDDCWPKHRADLSAIAGLLDCNCMHF